MNGIAERRVHSQQFDSSSFVNPVDVVSWLVAMQAQDYAGAKWSIGLRLPGSSDHTVEQALGAGSIIRTWALRGTYQLVSREDIHWLLAVVAPRVIAKNARRYRQLELDDTTLAQSNHLLAGILAERGPLKRSALRTSLEKKGVSTEGQRFYYMLQRASLDGLICQGVLEKKEPLFSVLTPENGGGNPIDREQALARLARRYFTSRGPATLDDFVWWSGLLVADAKLGLAGAKPDLAIETAGGKQYWAAATTRPATQADPAVYFLPGFDEYLVSYRDRSAQLNEQVAEAWSKSKAMFSPAILLNGQVIGLWKRTFKGNTLIINTALYRELQPTEAQALETAARHYADFLGKDAVIY